jgi:large subunit ribosomal protein L3
MTQIFDEAGNRQPVTVVTLGPCIVTQLKTPERDGYAAVQIAFEDKKKQRAKKPEVGHFKKADTTVKRFVREFRVTPEELTKFKLGMELKADIFQVGDTVDVVGTSKGKGFQGVLKRHHFGGFPATHGTHEVRRASGSVGMRTWPAKVIRGKRMAGHMGDEQVTVQNLKVLEVNAAENALVIRGSLPGHKRAMIQVSLAVKRPVPKREFKGAGAPEASADSAK